MDIAYGLRFSKAYENLNEDIPILSAMKMQPNGSIGSSNIRFLRIFPGVPWREGIKQQWGNQKHRFSGLSDASWSCSKFYQMLKLSCRDHKTFSLYWGLQIGYKDYIRLLTYSINCIFPTARNINI